MRLESLEGRCLLAGFPVPGEGDHDFPGEIPSGAIEGAAGSFELRNYPAKAVTIGNGTGPLSPPSVQSPSSIASKFLRDNRGLFGLTQADTNGLSVSSQSPSTATQLTHVYLQQVHAGIDVFGGIAGVSINGAGQVIRAYSSFAGNVAGTVNTLTPSVAAQQAISAAAANLGETASALSLIQGDNDADQSAVYSNGGVSRDPIPIKLEILPVTASHSRLVWNLVINMRSGPDWYEMNVDAVTGQVVGRYNYTKYDSYRVFPLPLEHPLDGPGLPGSHSVVTNPANATASPFGWHDTNGMAGPEFTDTRGNNVNAQEDRDGNNVAAARPSGGPMNDYDFPFDPTMAPLANVNEAVVNLFYWNNIIHDVFAVNGFTEASGNFQFTNYTGTGLGADPVEADAQDDATGAGLNNANFATPPDGQSGRMQMYEFDITTPRRDSDNDAGIIVHEFGHGISNRLVAGPANVTALNGIQSGGMGEGWGDFYGLVFTAKPTDIAAASYPVGTYVLNNTGGVRRFPYSTDLNVNPLTYNDIDINQSEVCTFICDEVHNVGEIWTSALWELYWNLVAKHGFDPNLYTGSGGNKVALQLTVEAMKLTPANPTMLQARDAILATDVAMTGGDNLNEIWQAFAKRGMGFSATDGGGHNDVDVEEAFDVPETQINGMKFEDLDGDGVFEPNDLEEPLAGWTIYIDANNNSQFDAGELFDVTADDGTYSIKTDVGVHIVREVEQAAYNVSFPAAGFHTVTITVDPTIVSNIDFGNQPESGQIRGVKFFDENGNGVRENSEVGQAGVTIQLFDSAGALFADTTTDWTGAYQFLDLPPLEFTVDEIVPANQTKTFPTPAMAGVHTIDLQPSQIRINVNFGNFGQRGSLSGRKFHDVNGNGVKDLDELGVADVLVYLDRNRDGQLNVGELVQSTDQFGYYKINNIVPGEYVVREFIPDGSAQTVPANGSHTVTVISGQELTNVNFGNRESRDYGDAPAPYPTTKVQDGASHGVRSGFHLGQRVDVDADGQPHFAALGDDATGTAFEPGFDYPVGDAPVGALTADLDGERGPDLVVVNQNSSNISVLLNNSDGTFADAVNYNVGANPSRVVAADFNGDGDLDLAVSNSGSNNVSILINRGDGTFMTAVNEPAGVGPRGIAAGDLDGDGLIDLAVSNTDEVVSVLLNDGAGGFDAPIEFEVNEGPVSDVAIGDIDRDGDRDLVVANADGNPATVDNKVSILFNGGVIAGNLTFGPAFDFVVGEEPLQVILADFDRDGALDIATANAVGQSVSVLLNRGTGTFFPGQEYDVEGPAQSLVAADIDNDTFRDIVVAAQTSGALPVLLNNGSGVFTRGDDLLGGSIGVFVVSADFNGDDGRDVAVVNQVADTITVINSAGDDEDGVTFTSLVRGRTGGAEVRASAAGILSAWIDFNADGDWNDPGEKVASDRLLTAGVNQVFFTVPATAVVGNTFARFRFSDQSGLGPAGLARAGEVEDYQVTIAATGGGGLPPNSPWTNPQNPLDVSGDGNLTLNDVLLLVNDLRMNGVHELPVPTPGNEPPPFLDANGDGLVTLNDVLLVINGLLVQNAQANGEAEGESDPAAPFVLLDRPAGSSTRNRRDENELHTCSPIAAGPAIDAGPGARSEETDDVDLIGEGEDNDWDDALEAIAGDVSLAWGKDGV
jgi:extracellular elastinolytic metalloproteinase